MPGRGGLLADRLTQGAVFWDMPPLTGQPRSASVLAATEALVFRLRKADLDPVLLARPALPGAPTTVMAERQPRDAARPAAADLTSAAAPTREDILARLESFLGIR